MNKERLLAVAEAIEKEPSLYDQREWGAPWCGTPGCIAGWAVALFSDDNDRAARIAHVFSIKEAALHSLGMRADQKYPLFNSRWPASWLPDHDNGSYSSEFFTPTARDAQRVLHKIVAGDIEP